jgi:uncharacterized protein (DUF2235 family)
VDLLPRGRNLVICCDGTNNQFGPDKTNVARLVKVLERDVDQLVYYDPGVGTLPEPATLNKLKETLRRWASLAFGFGLTANVVEAYTFLMNYWQPGDQVYLFGFSRGAYTVRVLAGLLHALGLLPRGNEQLVPYAMRLYGSVRTRAREQQSKSGRYWKLVNEFRSTFARPIGGRAGRRFPIHFMGVWDTVSSVGWVWEPKSYPYTFANPSVHIVRHAVAIDERRWFFRQNLFRPNVPRQDLLELWFPGVHADVGGGYSEDEGELWRVAFEWMLEEAKGLRVNGSRLKSLRTTTSSRPSWAEAVHESLTWKWWLAEFFPKWSYSAQTNRRFLTCGLFRSRVIEEGALIHPSAMLRNRDRTTNYQPRNMTAQFLEALQQMSEPIAVTPYAPTGIVARQSAASPAVP